MTQSPEEQDVMRASTDLDEAERLVANRAAAEKRGEKVDQEERQRSLDVLERLLAPAFRITRATGKVDDRDALLAVVKSGDRRYRFHKTSVDGVRVFGESAVVTGVIDTDGDYRGRPVRGRFAYTKLFVKEPAGWRCVGWQNTAIADATPDPGSVRAVYEEVCRAHAGITDFRTKLLGLLPLASGAGISLLVLGEDAGNRLHYLFPLGLFGSLVALGLYFYELRGIQLCKVLRERGRQLEQAFLLPSGADGAFSGRPRARGRYIGAEAAGHIIYSAVIGAWGYVTQVGWCRGETSWPCCLSWAFAFVFVTTAHVITQLLSRWVDWLSRSTGEPAGRAGSA